MTYGQRMESTTQRILEIVLDQRSVSDATIAMQVKDLLSEQEVEALTKRLEKQGLLAESEFAAGRWHVTDAGRSALDAE
jgi:DNA-binding Lrp family transcriptional regulator